MSRATHVTVLAADPTHVVGRLGAAADEVVVVTDAEALSPVTGSVLVVSGAAAPALVRAASAGAWSSVAVDVGVAVDAEALAALGPARPGQARWIGDLPVLSLDLGGPGTLDAAVLGSVSALLRDRRSEHEALGRRYFALEAERRIHTDALARLEADRETWTAEVERLTERARRAERGRRRARQEVARLRRSRPVRAAQALKALRRRVPGGTAGVAVVLLVGFVVALAAAGLLTWAVAAAGHTGLAAVGVLLLVAVAATSLILARLVLSQGRRSRSAAETEAEKTRLAFAELRRGQRSVRRSVTALDTTQEAVVQRLARVELALANLEAGAGNTAQDRV